MRCGDGGLSVRSRGSCCFHLSERHCDKERGQLSSLHVALMNPNGLFSFGPRHSQPRTCKHLLVLTFDPLYVLFPLAFVKDLLDVITCCRVCRGHRCAHSSRGPVCRRQHGPTPSRAGSAAAQKGSPHWHLGSSHYSNGTWI